MGHFNIPDKLIPDSRRKFRCVLFHIAIQAISVSLESNFSRSVPIVE